MSNDDIYIFTSNKPKSKLTELIFKDLESIIYVPSDELLDLVPDNNDRENVYLLLQSLFPIPLQEDDLFKNNETESSNDIILRKRRIKYSSAFNYYFQNDFIGVNFNELNNLR